ncbi:hypothetical protein HanHA300_Chr12g0436691 [Helianthus annuus]|nr:hypothetical protein HanHA300_Chr12g0436691 [Helianthus annuus]
MRRRRDKEEGTFLGFFLWALGWVGLNSKGIVFFFLFIYFQFFNLFFCFYFFKF